MGWFDEQIKQRRKNDEDTFSAAFVDLADAVLGTKRRPSNDENGGRELDAIWNEYKHKKM